MKCSRHLPVSFLFFSHESSPFFVPAVSCTFQFFFGNVDLGVLWGFHDLSLFFRNTLGSHIVLARRYFSISSVPPLALSKSSSGMFLLILCFSSMVVLRVLLKPQQGTFESLLLILCQLKRQVLEAGLWDWSDYIRNKSPHQCRGLSIYIHPELLPLSCLCDRHQQ